jgi:hypothetical protein
VPPLRRDFENGMRVRLGHCSTPVNRMRWANRFAMLV